MKTKEGLILFGIVGLFLILFFLPFISAQVNNDFVGISEVYNVSCDAHSTTLMFGNWVNPERVIKLSFKANDFGLCKSYINLNETNYFTGIIDDEGGFQYQNVTYPNGIITGNYKCQPYLNQTYWCDVTMNFNFVSIPVFQNDNLANTLNGAVKFVLIYNNKTEGIISSQGHSANGAFLITNNGEIINNYKKEIDELKINQTNLTNRLSVLELWKETINSWRELADRILLSVGEHDIWIQQLTERVVILENKTGIVQNGSLTNYFKYLSNSDRKSMVCGYAQESHLTQINDLGLSCIITYRQISTREYATCKCTGK
ncbi:MAG: hypothetical protein WC796_03645 [Candidatus Pacearchaeota archaeon]